MTLTYAVIPLDEAIAALDTPGAVADRKKRARAMAKELVGDARNAMLNTANRDEILEAQAPIRRAANLRAWNSSEPKQSVRDAEPEVGRNYDEICFRQCEQYLRRVDEAAVHADPDRVEAQRVWNAYALQVNAFAFQQGNKGDAWIARWRDLIAARHDAESFGDSTAAIDDRLTRLTGGIPYPVLPQAAWDTADDMPFATRQEEYDRLERKYGPREPVSTDTPQRRRGRA